MATIVNTIRELSNLLSLKSASRTEITDAELQLRIIFSDEYKVYLSTFGAIMADGIELTGISKAEHRNVVPVTKQEWELNNNVPHSMYVVENTGIDGVIIWQDASGVIYQTFPNAKPKQIASSLNEYIIQRMK
ncbi:cell wall assembly/cell proliferation coordinating protein, KNR4-like protein [Photobacterium carnosum]|uniref:SMI1/KNR4 family protein n=1 Tax=Photobacterium carnosum TaxID=2023717 RepID=UPI001C91D912|nr:SMI1/KNR4 family protein [Photobacterium carnosum]MBY3787652.1 cell wall assembly/cell proliferation coordinating protein, KNR4-like protein [Photobacterium carnosum]MCD9532282.1 cell wall assembly/cell proliferation coordinating protein, KNR4-like protein [Photobacterium carnosum]